LANIAIPPYEPTINIGSLEKTLQYPHGVIGMLVGFWAFLAVTIWKPSNTKWFLLADSVIPTHGASKIPTGFFCCF